MKFLFSALVLLSLTAFPATTTASPPQEQFTQETQIKIVEAKSFPVVNVSINANDYDYTMVSVVDNSIECVAEAPRVFRLFANSATKNYRSNNRALRRMYQGQLHSNSGVRWLRTRHNC